MVAVLTASSVISASDPGVALEAADVKANTSTALGQDTPAVARDAGGDFVVVWAGNGTQLLQTDTAGVFFQRYDLFGAAVGSETRVNTTTTGIQRNPAVAVDATGNFVVVWETCNAGGTACDIALQRFTTTGATDGNETIVNTTTTDEQALPTVAMAPGGASIVAWQSLNQDGSGNGIYAQRFNADGTTSGTEFLVNTTTAFSQIDPAAAIDHSGDAVIAWTSGDGAGNLNGVFARQFPSGAAAGAEFRANVTVAGDQTLPAVAIAAGGSFAITWQGPDADGLGVYLRRYDSAGTAQTAGDEAVNTTTTGDQGMPTIALDATGDIVVAWTGIDNASDGIFFQRYNASGTAQDGETPVNVTETNDQFLPATAADADGDFVVAWTSTNQDGGDNGIYFNRFSGPEDVDLKVTKTDSADPVTNAGPYSYTLTVENLHAVVTPTGTAAVDQVIGMAHGIVVQDVLPAGVGFVNGTGGTEWSCSNLAGTVTCALDLSLLPGTSSSVTLNVTAPAGGGQIDNTATVSGEQYDSVTANDAEAEITYACASANSGTLQFSAATFTVGEDGDDAGGNDDGLATVTVSRSGGSCGPASVEVTSSDGTALSGQDYTGLAAPVTLNWADGDAASKTFTVAITEEAAHELDTETFNLALANPDRATLGGQDTAVVNITDNDTPPTVTMSTTGSPFSENGGAATVTATLSKPAGRAVTVNLAYAAGPGANATGSANRGTGCGTATTPSDYTCSGTSISIAVGNTTGSVTLTGANDARDEDDLEAALITATCPTPAGQSDAHCTVNGAAPQVSPQVEDDDAVPAVQFSAASASVSEAQDPLNLPSQNRTATLTLQLSAASDRDVTVDFTSAGTALKGTDFTLAPDSPGSFTFTASQTSKTITATIIHDTVDEPDETVIVTLATPTNATLGANNPHTLTITDDEATPTVQWSAATSSATEASANPLQVTVTATLSAASSQTVTVPFTVGGTAANPEDHDAQAGTLTFTPGDVSEAYTYVIANDALDEASETVILTLGTPSAGATNGTTATHTTTIADDPADPLPVVSIDDPATPGTASESAGTTNIALKLNAASGRTVTVAYTITGSATNGADYTLSPASPVSFAAGETGKVVTVTLINDAANEANSETLILTLNNPTNATVAASPDNAHTLTITDDDDIPQVHFTDDAQSAVEGDGSVVATVQLSRTTNVDVTVPFTTGGTTSANDYTLLCPDGLGGTQACGGEIVVAAGQTTADITIDIDPDARVEADETLVLAIGTPVNATKNEPDDHTLTITNDDAAGVVVDPASADVIEGGAGDTYTIVLESEPSADVTIDLAVGADATVAPISVTFTAADWDTPKAITVGAVNDALAEGPHTDLITHTASSVDLDYQGIAVADVPVSVTDNDTPAIALTESAGSTRVTEGGATDTYTFVLTTQPTADVVITVTAGSSQVTRSPPTVTFTSADWNTPKAVTITADNDSVAEGNHGASVTHSVASADADYNAFPVRAVQVFITDDDVAGVSITPSGGSTAVAEGGAGDTYTIVLTSQPTADVTVNIATDAQLTADQASVTFTAVNWNLGRTINVSAVDDHAVEGDHSGAVTHTVTSTDPRYSGIATTGITASIADDDSVEAGDGAPAVVVTVTGGNVAVAGGGSLPASSLFVMAGLLALRRRRALALSLLAAVMVVPGVAQAQQAKKAAPAGSALAYRYAEFRYVSASLDDPSVDADGFALAGSWLVSPDVFLSGSYAQTETDDFTVQTVDGSVKSSTLSAGAGWRRALNGKADLTLAGALVYAKADAQGGFAGSASETGFSLEAGLRGWLAPKVEWGASANYLSIFDDDSTSLNGQALYHFTPKFAGVMGTGYSDSATQFNLGVRFGL